METLILACLGCAVVLGGFGAGALLGWKARGRYEALIRPRARPPGEEERRLLEEQQRAFRTMQNYNAERAYGMVRED